MIEFLEKHSKGFLHFCLNPVTLVLEIVCSSVLVVCNNFLSPLSTFLLSIHKLKGLGFLVHVDLATVCLLFTFVSFFTLAFSFYCMKKIFSCLFFNPIDILFQPPPNVNYLVMPPGIYDVRQTPERISSKSNSEEEYNRDEKQNDGYPNEVFQRIKENNDGMEFDDDTVSPLVSAIPGREISQKSKPPGGITPFVSPGTTPIESEYNVAEIFNKI